MAMKVLHVLEYSVPMLVGYTIRSKYIIHNQKRNGIDPVVITSPIMPAQTPALDRPETIDGIRYYRTGRFNRLSAGDNLAQRLYKRYAYSRSYLDAIKAIARKEKPDIIHSHSSYLNGIRAAQAARQLGMPSVFEVRGLWGDTAVANKNITRGSWKYKFVTHMEFKAMKRSDGVVTIARSLKNHLIQNGIDAQKIWVVPNGVDMSIFSPQEKNAALAAKLGLGDKVVFGFIGSVGAIEGLDIAVKAFSHLKDRSRAVFLIVGDGDDLPRLKELVRGHGLGSCFMAVGKVPHEQVRDYYSVIDVLVYPRIDADVNNRVTPLKPLEAMAMEKAVLASDVGGLEELVHDGVNGILFKRNDASDLCMQMGRIIDGGIDLRRFGEQARTWIRENRQWEEIVRQYNHIYNRIIG